MQDLEEIFGPRTGRWPAPCPDSGPGHRSCRWQAMSRRPWPSALAGGGGGHGHRQDLAYLVPALLSGQRVIVSTGTRTLQDQLFHRDLPLLGRALGRAVRVALLKGRANYLCRERYQRLPCASCRWASDDAALGATHCGLGAVNQRRATWPNSPICPTGHPLRERLTSTRDSCTGSRCAEFARCHVFAARRRANEADLVVVNHHLLLADLALKEEGFGDILPSADAVILDEAHQLPDLAAQFFGRQFSIRAGGPAAGGPARCWCRAASHPARSRAPRRP